ncbi:hypothetical protein [Streptomyces sp. NBC_00016]|uniref:hypothetical protein n=1 Tax=Streptomyces sp. NBC_00016 TaxID=2975622 RepID=UPI00386DF6C2
MVNLTKLALVAGYVAVEPGTRGRSLTNSDGTPYGTPYGTAPAVIVDLKAAVRYVKFTKGRIPGNTDRIVSTGTSAGGAVSALLGASGDSKIYAKYLKEAGAADASDSIFAAGPGARSPCVRRSPTTAPRPRRAAAHRGRDVRSVRRAAPDGHAALPQLRRPRPGPPAGRRRRSPVSPPTRSRSGPAAGSCSGRAHRRPGHRRPHRPVGP